MSGSPSPPWHVPPGDRHPGYHFPALKAPSRVGCREEFSLARCAGGRRDSSFSTTDSGRPRSLASPSVQGCGTHVAPTMGRPTHWASALLCLLLLAAHAEFSAAAARTPQDLPLKHSYPTHEKDLVSQSFLQAASASQGVSRINCSRLGSGPRWSPTSRATFCMHFLKGTVSVLSFRPERERGPFSQRFPNISRPGPTREIHALV